MDVCEAPQRVHRRREAGAIKQSSGLAEKRNGTATRPSKTREVNSRCKSPTPTVSRRCASPNVTRTVNAPTQVAPKRAISAGRKRPVAAPSPPLPTTPVCDTSVEAPSRKVTGIGSRLLDSLWPSTMRSLSVSFQSDSISIPASKKEKSVGHSLTDRTLKPSSNVAQKQAERVSVNGKPAPERRSPLRGRNSSDQSENSRPVDQHRWPSRAGGKLSSSTLMRRTDFSDKAGKSSSLALRRLSDEGISRPLHRNTSADEIGKMEGKAVDKIMPRLSMLHKLNLSKTSHSVPSSPRKASPFRGMVSPSRTRPSTPTSSRGTTSPSRLRPSSPSRQLSTATSVLGFAPDLKRGKKSTNQLEDAHRLRLLYNRYLQWRFANAQSEAALHIQKVIAEDTLYNVWWENLELWDSVITKRINLQQLQLELNLNVVLNEQLAYLEDWASLERDHSTSLVGVINDLKASTLRLPITGGAKSDIASLKAAISSAVDVMQGMTSSIHSVLSKVEETNCSVSELSELAALERATLDECEAMLSSIASMQAQKYSLRAQLIQQLQGLRQKNVQLLPAI